MSVVANVAINIDGKQAQSLLKAIQGEVEKLNGSFDQIPKKTGGIFEKLKGAASSVVGQLAAATGAAFTLQQAFNTLAEQSKAEGALKSLGVNADVASAQFMNLSNELKGQASAVELTAAAYDVASAGFMNVSDQAIILEASTKGAVGGMSDLNTVGNAVTSVLNAYGMSAAEAGNLVDGFIQTQNDGKIILAEYATQIGRLAPTANAAGVGIDELNAAIGTITAQGVPVEAAFTGLNQALVAILKPTAEAQSLAKELGIEFNEAGLRTKGFGGLLADVAQATGGSTTRLTQLFGSVDALKAVLPLVSGNMEKFNKNLENQKNSTGVADKAFRDMGETLQGALRQVDSAFKNLVVSFKPVTPAIIAPFKILAGAIDLVSNNIKALAKTAIFLGTFAAVLNASAIATKAWAVATGLLAAAKKAAGVAAAFLQGVMNPASLATTALALGAATAAAVALGGAMGESGVKAAEAKGKQSEVADETARINTEIEKMLAGIDQIPTGLEDAKDKTKQLKEAQDAVTKGIEASSQAIDKMADAQTAGVDRILSVTNARIEAEKAINNVLLEQAQRQLDGAISQEGRVKAAGRILELTIEQAKLERESAYATIEAEKLKLDIAVSSAKLKEQEVKLAVELARIQGTVLQAHYDTLSAATELVSMAVKQQSAGREIAKYQKQTADASFKGAESAAKAAYQSNITVKSSGSVAANVAKTATSMDRAANSTGKFVKYLEIASSAAEKAANAASSFPAFAGAGAIKDEATRNTMMQRFNEIGSRRPGQMGFTPSVYTPVNFGPMSQYDRDVAAFATTVQSIIQEENRANTSSSPSPGAERLQALMAETAAAGARAVNISPQINVTTGPVIRQDNQDYVTMTDLERAMQQTATGVITSLQTPAGRYTTGIR